jgi:hypothetical protein
MTRAGDRGRKGRLGFWACAAVALAAGCSTDGPTPPQNGGAGEVARATSQALQSLKAAFPGVRVDGSGARSSRIYGAQMTTGANAAEAAERFRQDHAAALGVQPDELVLQDLQGRPLTNASPPAIGLMYDRKTGQHKYWLYRYGQWKSGMPVHGGEVRTLVRNAPGNPVVWVSSSVRDVASFAPRAGVQPSAADPDKTLRSIRASSDFTGRALPPPTRIVSLSRPTAVVFAGTETRAASPRLAMQYQAETDGLLNRFAVVADAETGDVLETRGLIVFDDISGTVAGNVTTGAKAMECAAEAPTGFAFAEVIGGGGSAFADLGGAFTLSTPGTAAVSVTSPTGGQFFDVFNNGVAAEQLTLSVAPPGPASFLHNDPPTQTPATIAQANGYANSNEVRQFLLGYLPTYPTISSQINFPVNVNLTGGFCPGNAWYDGSSINFCVASIDFGNTSFASVNHHEFGHHIVQMGGSGQGAYGEGMSDVVAALLAGDPGLGYGFFLNQCTTPLRNADNDCQFSATSCSSCGSEVHACGNLISGAIWSVRERLALTEPEDYIDIINSLSLSSIPMHTGTTINAQIAIDLLTLDDTDGNIDNGTPHRTEICEGFAEHGMFCPPLLTGLSVSPAATLSSEGQVGGPFAPASIIYTLENLGPTALIAYQVAPQPPAAWLTITNGSGQLAIGQQAQVTVAIDQAVAAGLAKGPYDAVVQFTNTTDGVGNTSRAAHLEVGVPLPIFTETFEGGLGTFTVDAPTPNLWHVVGATCASAQSGHSPPNSLYYGVDSTCTFSTGLTNSGTATSTSINIADTSVVKLRFKYFLQTEHLAPYDRATAQVSVNGGTFTVVAANHSGGQVLQDGAGTWQTATVDISSLVAGLPSASVRLRFGFATVDSAFNNFAGFLVDDVQVLAFSGTPCTEPSQCDDGAFCNGAEQCTGGTCTPGTPVTCNDGVSCTADSCNEATDACVFVPNNALCDDGQMCNGAEVCNATTGCQPGTPLDCNDGNACTADSCSPTGGCQNVPVSCDDGNPCTVDSCSPTLGCQNTPAPNGTACTDDGNVCTNDVCTAGACTHPNNTNPCADDGNVCTNDVCSAGACTHPNNTNPCADDGNVCTSDVCSAGACTHPNNTDPCADDGNVCTTDVCSAGACTHPGNTNPCADDGDTCTSDVCAGGVCTHPSNGTCTAGAFLESGGQVTIEAEHFMTNTGRASHNWVVTNNTGASGGQVMSANPNNGANINTGYVTGSPQLDYRVNFLTTGTYQVWVRGIGPSGDDDSVHSGIDGTGPASADRLSGFTTALSWRKTTLDGANATINVTTPGLHTINIWMREDGFQADKILLTTSAAFTPSGAGPAESARGSSCTSSASCNDNSPCTVDSCVTGLCQYTPAAAGTACADDGNVCTTDVCQTGVCNHNNNTAPCADDGNSCTNDVCAGGVCTHPNNGSCAAPCAGQCSNPIIYTGPGLQSGALGTAPTCHQTMANLSGGNCGNFAASRQLFVNGVQMSCSGGNWPSLPPKVNGGYCIRTTAGDFPWAFITTW